MVLSPNASYPHGRTYVLKLHRDAAPLEGRICGRLQHIASGQECDFTSSDELLACLQHVVWPEDET